jgi:ADP-ribosyl-[dinitrogen reductase] hydrolase
MALCLADSLLECGRFDPADQITRYIRWWKDGYRSSTGRCFDIGLTIQKALSRYRPGGNPFCGDSDPWAAGNGCIMRLAPVPMYFHTDPTAAVHWAGESSRTTHAAAECIEACRLLAGMILAALAGRAKDDVLFDHDPKAFLTPKVRAIAEGTYRTKSNDDISASGYVIHCFEAAAWCVATTESFHDAVLKAVNLGEDADTTGAVCGQIAGALYGETGIPQEWRTKLVRGDEIGAVADRLAGGP